MTLLTIIVSTVSPNEISIFQSLRPSCKERSVTNVFEKRTVTVTSLPSIF